jgi:hypothetical protein
VQRAHVRTVCNTLWITPLQSCYVLVLKQLNTWTNRYWVDSGQCWGSSWPAVTRPKRLPCGFSVLISWMKGRICCCTDQHLYQNFADLWIRIIRCSCSTSILVWRRLIFTTFKFFNHPPIHWVSGAISSEVKRSGREADHSPSSNAEVKNGRVILPLPHKSSWRSHI